MTDYHDIEATELQTLMATQPILLVDVRSVEEMARGVIPGATPIPLPLIPLRLSDLQGTQPLVFYCHSGVRSAQACAFMAGQARGNLFNLRGGILAWGKAGYVFETIKLGVPDGV